MAGGDNLWGAANFWNQDLYSAISWSEYSHILQAFRILYKVIVVKFVKVVDCNTFYDELLYYIAWEGPIWDGNVLRFYGASTSQVIGACNEIMDDDDGQMIFGDLVGLKLPDIRLTDEEKPRKNLIQETCSVRGSNPGPLRDRRACYHLFHRGGQNLLRGKLLELQIPVTSQFFSCSAIS